MKKYTQNYCNIRHFVVLYIHKFYISIFISFFYFIQKFKFKSLKNQKLKEVIIIGKKGNLINCQINIDKREENNYNVTNKEKLTFGEIIRLLRILENKPVNEEYNGFALSDNSAEYIIENRSINNSHDKIFRTILGKENEALYLINKFLNNPLQVTDIEKYNSSYITKKLENRECDIVYKLKEKDVYFLIEHQTAVDKNMPTRLLEYMVEIIKSASTSKKHKKDELAVIMPIVLYTGKRRWTVKRYVKDIFSGIQQYKTEINKLELYQLIDVNNYTGQELLESESFITKAMLIQKIKSGEDFKEIVIKIRNTLKNEDEFELFEKILRQILLKNMKLKEREKFIEEIMKGGEGSMWNAERVMMNEAKKLRKEGMRSGIMQVIKSMLEANEPIEKIAKYTNFSEKEIRKIK